MDIGKMSLDLNLLKIDADPNGSYYSTLAQSATMFLRAGGTLLWSDWRDMSSEERAAFVEANQVLTAERAFLTGRSAHGIQAALEVFSQVDGGQALTRLELERWVAEVAERIEKEGMRV